MARTGTKPVAVVREVEKEWFTRKEAAKYTGLSVDTIKELQLSGQLPFYKLNATNKDAAGGNGRCGVTLTRKGDIDKLIRRYRVRVADAGTIEA